MNDWSGRPGVGRVWAGGWGGVGWSVGVDRKRTTALPRKLYHYFATLDFPRPEHVVGWKRSHPIVFGIYSTTINQLFYLKQKRPVVAKKMWLKWNDLNECNKSVRFPWIRVCTNGQCKIHITGEIQRKSPNGALPSSSDRRQMRLLEHDITWTVIFIRIAKKREKFTRPILES